MDYNEDQMEKEMQRLAQIVIDKGYETKYWINGKSGANVRPTFLETLRRHVLVTHKDRDYPMFPVPVTGAPCGLFRTGALFAAFEVSERGKGLTIQQLRLTLRDDDDRLVNHYIELKKPEDMPELEKAKHMMIAKYKYLDRQYRRRVKMKGKKL